MFLSHTSELAEYPSGGSYIQRAKDAVIAAGHRPVCMEFFPASDAPPADYDVAAVGRCDVYVGIYGTRFGTPVPGRPDLSYTEQEFEAATKAGMRRLLFLTDPESEELRLPQSTQDIKYGYLQQKFRERVRDSDSFIVKHFRNPDHLATLLGQALRALADEQAGLTSNRSSDATPNRTAAAKRPVPKYLPHLPDRQGQDDVLAQALCRWWQAPDPLPLVVMLHGEREQALPTYVERFCAHTAPLLLGATAGARPALTHCELPEPARFATMAADDWMEYFDNRLRMNSAVNLTLAEFSAARPEPVVIQSSLDPTRWADGGAALLEQVCQFWRGWGNGGNLASGRKRLIHFIVMSYHKPKRPTIRPHILRWLFLGYWHHKWTIRRFDRLCRRLDAGIGEIKASVAPDAIVLPPFGDVSHADVLHWLESDPVKTFLGDADPWDLRQKLQQLLPPDPQAPLPMEVLAEKLHSLLSAYAPSR